MLLTFLKFILEVVRFILRQAQDDEHLILAMEGKNREAAKLKGKQSDKS